MRAPLGSQTAASNCKMCRLLPVMPVCSMLLTHAVQHLPDPATSTHHAIPEHHCHHRLVHRTWTYRSPYPHHRSNLEQMDDPTTSNSNSERGYWPSYSTPASTS